MLGCIEENKQKMIAMIRIRGEVKVNRDVEETLFRLRLRKKYTCILIQKLNKEQIGMVKNVRNYTAYGEISEKTLENLIEKRGKLLDKTKKKDSKKIAEELIKGKSLEELNIKPFFRLHPARGGIKSKIHFPKGVLGNNHEEINKLIMRML